MHTIILSTESCQQTTIELPSQVMPGLPKQTSGVRRPPSSLSKVSTPATTSTSKQSKTSKPTLIARLKLSTAHLSQFPHESSPTEKTNSKASPSAAVRPPPSTGSTPSALVKSESDASISVTAGGDDPQSSDSKIKQDDTNGIEAGEKRELDAGVEGDDKAKAKSGQRKRPKVYVYPIHQSTSVIG